MLVSQSFPGRHLNEGIVDSSDFKGNMEDFMQEGAKGTNRFVLRVPGNFLVLQSFGGMNSFPLYILYE